VPRPSSSASAPSSSASLVARGLTAHRGAGVVLDAIDLAVGPGSRVGVVGPNGVGKTTLLRLLAGIDEPDGGAVERVPPWSSVGYLPQEPERQPDETLHAFLARRSGVAAASALLERTAEALAGAPPSAVDAELLGTTDPADAYSRALERYLALGGPDFDARVEEVCADIGLGPALLASHTASLSGGEAARASLAAVLVSRFDVFLLDEPTNDLDFAGLDRLERFLAELTGAVVVVSHDRAFLERVISSVLEIDEHTRKGTEYRGGWEAFLEHRATARRHASEAFEGYQAERKQLLERARAQRQWAVKGVAKAKREPRDNDKAQRDFFINKSEKLAGKVKITERAIERLDRASVEKPWEGWDLHLELPTTAGASEIAAWMRGAVVERGSFRLGPVDLEIRWRDRVGLLGPNGSGKTTLIGAVLGRVPLASGEHGLGPSTVVGELDQARRRLASERPLLDVFVAASDLLPREARSLLAKFGLAAGHVERPATTLSPGERTRAELALLSAVGTNFLVLDEPTNHLDLPAIEQLEQALERYDGTVVLVTHDRRLLESVELTHVVELGAADGGTPVERSARPLSRAAHRQL
jgi:ATPase subunit of ABC transporter with duplicated ATPase domains